MASMMLYGCLILFAAVFVIDAKTVHSKRQYGGEEMPDLESLECMMNLFTCAAPIMSINEEMIRAAGEAAGIRGICGIFSPVSACLEPELASCGDQFPPEVRQPLTLATDLINFICRDEIDSIMADQDCIFGDEAEAASKRCNEKPSGEVCNLVEDTQCGIDAYEETCKNPSLANKFRKFVAKLEADASCHKAKARSLNWLKALNIMRRR